MKTKILIIAVCSMFYFATQAQTTGSVKGRILDKMDGMPVPNAHVFVMLGGQMHGVTTDSEGHFHLKMLGPGTHELHVTCMGYSEQVMEGVNVLPGRPTLIKDIRITDASFLIGGETGAVVRARAEKKLIDPMDPIMKPLDADDIENLAGNHNINDIVRTISPEIQIPDNGAGMIVRGSRSGSSQYVVDGVKGNDSPSFPAFAINSISVYTGGIPAQYGDVTGGLIIIETKSYFDFLARENAKKQRKKEMEEM